MKAIVVREFGEPGVMRIEDVADPKPGVGEVLVRLRAAGVNPVDTYIRKGAYARKPDLPFTPGSDGAGIVEAAGDEKGPWEPGARVYVSGTVGRGLGTYAEMTLCARSQVHALPDGVSFEEGAAVGVPYGTAWRALLQRGGAKPGETVLIHGASGGVGVAALQVARKAGLRTFGTSGTERGAALVRVQGAAEVFDHRAAGYEDQIREATGGRGVDLIIEMLANVNLARDLALLAPFGRIVVVGNRGTIEINPRETMAREADIRGMLLWNTPADEMAAIHAGIGQGLRDGSLKPVVGREFPLSHAPAAHEAVMEPGAYGKIVLNVEVG